MGRARRGTAAPYVDCRRPLATTSSSRVDGHLHHAPAQTSSPASEPPTPTPSQQGQGRGEPKVRYSTSLEERTIQLRYYVPVLRWAAEPVLKWAADAARCKLLSQD